MSPKLNTFILLYLTFLTLRQKFLKQQHFPLYIILSMKDHLSHIFDKTSIISQTTTLSCIAFSLNEGPSILRPEVSSLIFSTFQKKRKFHQGAPDGTGGVVVLFFEGLKVTNFHPSHWRPISKYNLKEHYRPSRDLNWVFSYTTSSLSCQWHCFLALENGTN